LPTVQQLLAKLLNSKEIRLQRRQPDMANDTVRKPKPAPDPDCSRIDSV
jgi:hypothetical protein